MTERLQKILARAGYGSRRSAEDLIRGGRVRLNGRVVTQLGVQANETDQIEVDGRVLPREVAVVHIALNKPPGYLTTARDPQRRKTVMELIPPGLPPHVLPVGRLDADTEGLLLLTNDGELAHRVAHPRYSIDKEYVARVDGRPTNRALAALRSGVEIEGKRTAPAEADVVQPPRGRERIRGASWLRIVIHEGRKRQIRLMCSAVGHPVRELVRVRIGNIKLGRLARGQTRLLTERELRELRRIVGLV